MNQVEGTEIKVFDDNGKLIKSSLNLRHRKYKTEEPIYVKAYLEDLRQILSVNRGDIAVLIELMKYMRYDNSVDINTRTKKLIISGLGKGTEQTVSNSVGRLKKAFLILPLSRGSYLIDPKLFAKGSWGDIVKIHMMITYNADGSKTIKTEFDKKVSPEIPLQNE